MSISEFIDHLNSSKYDELKNLYKKPIKETKTQMPKYQVFTPHIFHQADILYLPHDGKYKFLLVVVDIYDNTVDARPIKDILSSDSDVLDAFKSIYSGKYLKFPKILTLDKGSEFNRDTVKQYFRKNKVDVKFTLTARSRQNAIVERMNQTIGNIILKLQANEELITGQKSTKWVDNIPELIAKLNTMKKKPVKGPVDMVPLFDDYTKNMLSVGQKVRVLLDYPVENVKETRVGGKFRSGDIRWSQDVYEITELLLKPSFPPMYLVNDGSTVSRTKNQLQVVSKNEKEPDAKFINQDNINKEYSIISKILDKKIENRKTYFLCKWKGYPENEATWLHSKELDRTQDLRDMKREYNEEND